VLGAGRSTGNGRGAAKVLLGKGFRIFGSCAGQWTRNDWRPNRNAIPCPVKFTLEGLSERLRREHLLCGIGVTAKRAIQPRARAGQTETVPRADTSSLRLAQ
jgi:hypothetical protein